MSKKEMLKKQNERNRLRRKNKEKLLATLLTSGLLTCAINAQPVLANTLEPSIDTASIQSRASSATIEKQTVVINKLMPSDVVIRNVNFNGLDVQYLNIYTYRISGSELIISEEEGTITIPREVIETKIIPNITVKSCVMSIIFSDQSYLSGQVSVKITEDEIILPPAPETPPTNGDSNTGSSENDKEEPDTGDTGSEEIPSVPTTPDDNKEPGNGDVGEGETPETPGENPDDNKEPDNGDVGEGETPETPGNAPDDNKEPGNGDVSEEETPETPGDAPDDNKEPGNGDVSEEETPETPGDDNNEFVGAPDIKHEQVTFDYKEPKDIVLENLDLKGLKITKFFINNVEVDTSYLDVTENSITISKDAFLYLSLYNGVNSVEFHFSNGSVISNALEVTTINNKDKVEDDEINKPTEETKPEESDKPSEDKPEENNQAALIPVMNKEDFIFNRDNASDIVLKNIDLKGLSLKEVYIYATKIDVNRLKVTNNSITIPKEVIWDLYFKNGTYYLAFHFSNGAIISGYTSITITDNVNVDTVKPPNNNNTGAITPPPNSNTNNGNNSSNNNTTKPPVVDKEETNTTPVVVKPEIKKQTIEFNRDKATDVVISDVNFKGLTLKDFYIYGRKIDIRKLKVTENSIIIPKEVMWGLYLKNGTYNTSAIFSNGTYVSGVAYIKMTDGGSIYPETKPEDSVIRYPEMIKQGFEFDWADPRGINITYVNFNGTTLKSVKIGNKILNSDSFITTDNSIHISAEVLESLRLSIGVYNISCTFSNGVTLTGYSDLTVVHSDDIVTKPIENITFDKTNDSAIEIPDLIPEGTKVNSITINNKVLDVIYKDDDIALISDFDDAEYKVRNFTRNINPVVYIENGKLIIPTEILEYIGSDSIDYNISVRLDDGSKVTKQIILQSAEDDEIADDNITDDDNSNNGGITDDDNDNTDEIIDDNFTDNGTDEIVDDSITDSVIDKDNTIITTSPNTNSSAVSSNTITANTSASNISTTITSSVPKTGSAASTGLFASLLASIAGFRFTRKRK